MTVATKRKKLHRVVDALPERHLGALAEFADILQLQAQRNKQLPTFRADNEESLLSLVERIQNTPFNPDNISEPTKSWADYAAERNDLPDASFDASAWNEQWDEIEGQIEAASLAHEELERRQDW